MEQEHEKNGQPSIGKSGGGWTTKIHLLAQDTGRAIAFRLSPGNCHDAAEGEGWLKGIDFPLAGCPMIMDPADEGDTARPPALDLIFSAVIPAKSNRLDPWESDQELYQKRNEVEGLFRGRKGFGRIFSGWDQLDRMFSAFGFLVLIVDSLRSC
ncbi:MAG: hypothetical protein QGH37_14030 [Candidatus Poribacteria bacterium]|jgi:hypothetical protein|nr:hypothetical protein [Candidatus Poribacteria bacterium]